MADTHIRILGIIEPKAMCDLLRTPGRRPAPTLTINGTASFPYHIGAIEADARRVANLTGKPFFDVGPQRRVGCKLARPWAARSTISMPLCRNRPVLEVAAPRGGIASDLA
jgi:hypothetical protein